MNDVSAWLAQRGLERYAAVFAEHDVDLAVLKTLSEADLRELGLPLGARKRILQAIAASAAPSDVSTAPGADPSRPDAERRQITVMFSDVVGSTALSEHIDAEDLRALMLRYQHACAQVIAAHEGHIAQYLGDGVLAYFGYPHAHEDDAVRAVRVALAILEQMDDVNRDLVAEHGVALGVRIGVHTGHVVVGEMGGGPRREQLAVGETPNVAARVQGLAEPGTVVVSETTWRLVGGFFTAQPLGSQSLKGLSRPIDAYRILSSTGLVNPFEARLSRVLTPLVSREVELSFLALRWARTTDGEGQVVIIHGEPGIGKSRLVRAFRDRLPAGDHRFVGLQCSAQHGSSALHPVRDYLARVLEFEPNTTDVERQTRLRDFLARHAVSAEAFVPMAAALGILARNATLPGSPDERRRLTFDALVQVILATARERPLLLVIEDMHWIDPSTQDLIGHVIDAMPEERVMLLATARPEYRPPWSGISHVGGLTLGRLSRRETETMVRHLAGDAVSTEVVAQLLARSEGVPLFVEELTRATLDAAPSESAQGAMVPESLQDALTARLDRLAPARELIQIAALLGRVFDVDVLRHASQPTGDDVEQALSALANAGLVHRRTRHDRDTFEFKHALIQQAASGTLVRRQRRALHARIADALRRIRPEVVQHQPEVVAHHLEEAGDDRAALGLWSAAGDLAIQRSASVEAVDHLTRAVTCLGRLGRGAVDPEQETTIHLSLTHALMQAEGYRAPALLRAIEAAERSAAESNSLMLRCRVALQTAPALYGVGRNDKVVSAVQELIEGTADQVGHALYASMLVVRGVAHYNRGEFLKAEPEFNDARDLLLQIPVPERVRLGGGDGLIVAEYYVEAIARTLGRLETAHAVAEASVAHARSLDDPYSKAWALFGRARACATLGDYEAALADAEEIIAIAQNYRFLPRLATGLYVRAMARAGLNLVAEAIADSREALTAWRGVGGVFLTPAISVELAALLLRAGQRDEARRVLDEVDALVAGTDEASALAECSRVRGLIALDEAEIPTALEWLSRAASTARDQGARLYELRATNDLAELLIKQQRTGEVYRMVEGVYSGFTEGHRAPDLQRAKAILDRCRSRAASAGSP